MDKYIAIPSGRLFEIIQKYIDHKQTKVILGELNFKILSFKF